ncbi:hypothetical protein [Geobacter sp. AOG2]|uniref:hypothetical protein n=1 Tax=Geobacter sp. AOG2 TaxID=1566347 RepID=UPI001CC7FB7C|nr:hypothetical protein [Geobacter sp. AOG2]GFE62161.1 hypothetical protein AOG2_27490 [Geobacter sp. AOG2]
MLNLSRIFVLCLFLATSLLFISCSNKNDPAIAVCKEFIKKAATGDKTLKDIIDFDTAAQKYGSTQQEIIKKAGTEKWNAMKDDMVATIISTFAPLKNNYGSAFKDFKVEEKGVDYWIVSYINPVKERKMMMVKQRDGKLKAYFYKR